MDAFGGLTPSQTIRSSSGGGGGSSNGDGARNAAPNAGDGSSGSNSNNNARKNGRNRKRNKNKNGDAEAGADAATAITTTSTSDGQKKNPPNEANRRRQRNNNNNNNGKKKGGANNNNNNNEKNSVEAGQEGGASNDNTNNTSDNPNTNTNGNGNNKPKKSNTKNKRNRKKFPWRKHIPNGEIMDPITLDALVTLPYPPFALRASAPYIPSEWPPIDEKEKEPTKQDSEEEARERERRLLQEQWGGKMPGGSGEDKPQDLKEAATVEFNPTHINLFDGRALAYYMVSQLQFIDPLNRRDLTRDELCHLDRYLKRNGFHDLNVVEAYDTKGVSLSTAGAASTTAAGRVEILQQEAQNLLNTLFGRGSALPTANTNSNSNSSNSNSNSNNPLMQQYSNYQASQQQQQQYQQQSSNNNNIHQNTGFQPPGTEPGIYADEDGGMVVIDDDMNPSLRGGRGLRPFRATPPGDRGRAANNNGTPALWSNNPIRPQGQAGLQADNFPALSTVATLAPDLSALNFTANSFVPGGGSRPAPAVAAPAPVAAARVPKKPLPKANTLSFITKAVKKTNPAEAQRQFEAREEARRKAILQNLTFGSTPLSWDVNTTSTNPSSLPAPSITEGQLERNRNFADALGVATAPRGTNAVKLLGWARPTTTNGGESLTQYPDSLVLNARENMTVLLKVERKWRTFLEDDKAASLPLNKMDRPTRKLVHEYSDYWKLQTESFDYEPKRYIHCVKLLDTSSPYPLLSDAARRWRGPTGNISSLEHSLQHQTAGQDTSGGEVASNSRAAALMPERPKLELKERTLPAELPPFQPPVMESEQQGEDADELLRRRDARERKKKDEKEERELLKRRTLEAAFASDSEHESLGEVDADVEWEEAEALYVGSDDEEGDA